MDYKKHISENLKVEGVESSEIYAAVAVPPDTTLGDYALPCFKFAKIMRKSPVAIAEQLASEYVTDNYISKVTAVNGYLNFTVNRKYLVEQTLTAVLAQGENYGSDVVGNGKTICMDYSSINVAKPFHIGHLMTTVIGSSLCKILRFIGYKVVGINHLGDYGTQFGKLIVAFKLWSSREAVEKDKLTELVRIYVKFHAEAEKNPELDDQARLWFKRIEDGDKEAGELFEFFKEITLTEVNKIYKLLNVTFDSYNGESFYNDKMDIVVKELKESGLLQISNGASVVDLQEYDMPPCLILKSDGSSLYATRDLAAAYYRKNTYDFDKCLYVVAYQQNLHFKQIFKVLDLLGKPWAKDMVHVAYGMVSLEDGAMSTREGRVVLLQDVIDRCIQKSYDIINAKTPDLENKQDVARKVGTGAVIFGALFNNKIKDVVFSYDKALNFDGETCPYVQYTAVRCKSVLNKCGESSTFTVPDSMKDCEYNVISKIAEFNSVVLSAAEKYEPSYVTRYAVELTKLYNKFYLECNVANSEQSVKGFRIALTKATLTVLTNALGLLGIEIPDKM